MEFSDLNVGVAHQTAGNPYVNSEDARHEAAVDSNHTRGYVNDGYQSLRSEGYLTPVPQGPPDVINISQQHDQYRRESTQTDLSCHRYEEPQLPRRPLPPTPTDYWTCNCKIPKRVPFALFVAILVLLVVTLTVALSVTLTKPTVDKPPTVPTLSSTTQVITTTITSGPQTTTSDDPIRSEATHIADCRTPEVDGDNPQIREMCWVSDTRLFMIDSDERILIVDFHLSDKRCETTAHEVGITAFEIACSKMGEIFVLGSSFDHNRFIWIYKNNGEIEYWKPDEFPFGANSLGMNDDYIVLTSSFQIVMYNHDRQIVSKIPLVSEAAYTAGYLSDGNYLWCAPMFEYWLRVYNLNQKTNFTVNGVEGYHITGTGDYVFVEDFNQNNIRVYHQNGTFSHLLQMDVVPENPGPVAINRESTQRGRLMAVGEHPPYPWGYYKLYYLNMS